MNMNSKTRTDLVSVPAVLRNVRWFCQVGNGFHPTYTGNIHVVFTTKDYSALVFQLQL